MARKLIAAGWTVDAFVQACIVCGTDFYEKKHVLGRLQVPHIFASLHAMVANGQCYELTASIDHFIRWLQLIYCQRLKLKQIVEPAEIARKCKAKKWKTMGWPLDADIQQAFKELVFNYHYWRSLQFRFYCLG